MTQRSHSSNCSRIIDLKPLNTEECHRLWQMVSGDGVSEHEIRPLEILTGGSPRLLVIVGEFARHQSVRQLMEELVKLIDDHTEYFRGHLESFAKSERRVYLAVIDLWQPSRTGEIAARARMEVRTVSALLGRLVATWRGNHGGIREEAAIRRGGASLQHLLQTATSTRRSGRCTAPDSLHGGVLPRMRRCAHLTYEADITFALAGLGEP